MHFMYLCIVRQRKLEEELEARVSTELHYFVRDINL